MINALDLFRYVFNRQKSYHDDKILFVTTLNGSIYLRVDIASFGTTVHSQCLDPQSIDEFNFWISGTAGPFKGWALIP